MSGQRQPGLCPAPHPSGGLFHTDHLTAAVWWTFVPWKHYVPVGHVTTLLPSGLRRLPRTEALGVHLVLSFFGLSNELRSVLPGLLREGGMLDARGEGTGGASRGGGLPPGGSEMLTMPLTSLTKGRQCKTLYFA